MKKILLFCLFAAPCAYGQGAHVNDNVFTTASNVPVGAQAPLFSVPNSKVTVCAYPAVGAGVCTNKASIFGDQALTQPALNPITTDGQGRFSYWVAAGTYSESIQSANGSFIGTYAVSVGGAGSGGGIVNTVGVATANGLQGSSTGGANPVLTVGPDGTHCIPTNTGASGTFLSHDCTYQTPPSATGVTSVGLSLPPTIFSVTGTPVTGTGVLTATMAGQAANLFFASPVGASGAPAFRGIVGTDLPAATSTTFGAIKPDGTSCTVSAGVLTCGAGSFTLTTTGSSGPSTYTGGILNIPQYSGGGAAFPGSSGVVFNTSTTASRNAVFGDIVSLWTSCGSNFLKGDGTCANPAGAGTVTAFAAPSGSWPTWLVPVVTNSTSTPSLAVTASAIPAALLTAGVLLAPTANQQITQPSHTNFAGQFTDWGANPIFTYSFANGTDGNFANNYLDFTGSTLQLFGLENKTAVFTFPGFSWNTLGTTWATMANQYFQTTKYSRGILDTITNITTSYAPDDVNAIVNQIETHGGCITSADECTTPYYMTVTEGAPANGHVVSGGTTGSSAINATLDQGVGNGRLFVDTTATTGVITTTQSGATGIVVGNGMISKVTLGTTVTASYCGNVTANISTPRIPGPGTTTMSLTMTPESGIAYAGSATAIATSGGSGFIDTFNLVSIGAFSGGNQTFTAALRRPILSGAKMCIGGLASYGQLNTTSADGGYYFQVIGSPDTTHAYLAAENQGVIGAVAPSGTSTVTFTPIATVEGTVLGGGTNTYTLGSNIIAFVNGDAIYSPNDPTQIYRLDRENVTGQNHYAQFAGRQSAYSGAELWGGNNAFNSVTGFNDPTKLLDFGGKGVGFAIDDIILYAGMGQNWHNPPTSAYYSGQTYPNALFNVGCDNPTYCGLFYLLYDTSSRGNKSYISVNQATNTFNFANTGLNAHLQMNGVDVLTGLPTQSANTVLGSLTATVPTGLPVPSCSGATNALIWTSGTGFGCNTLAVGGSVTHTGALTAQKIMVGNTAADSKVDANASLDGSGNLVANSLQAGSTALSVCVTNCLGLLETSTALTPTASQFGQREDSTSHNVMVSRNGGAEQQMVLLDSATSFLGIGGTPTHILDLFVNSSATTLTSTNTAEAEVTNTNATANTYEAFVAKSNNASAAAVTMSKLATVNSAVTAAAESADYHFLLRNAGTVTDWWQMLHDGGMTSTGVTGGDKGPGTINAAGLYVNGTAVGAGSMTWPSTPGIAVCTGTPCTAWTTSLALPLTVANGGTGTTTPGIVAGTNVTVTGTWPNQTVNASAAGGGVNSGTAFSPGYYATTGATISGVTPFTGFEFYPGSAAPRAAVQADFNPFLTAPGPIGSGTPNTVAATTVTAHQVIASGSAPTVVLGAGAGTGPSGLTVTGTDMAGTISFTTGTSPTVSATVFTLTFNSATATAPKVVTPSAGNINWASSGLTRTWPNTYSTTGWVMSANASGLTASTLYVIQYWVVW